MTAAQRVPTLRSDDPRAAPLARCLASLRGQHRLNAQETATLGAHAPNEPFVLVASKHQLALIFGSPRASATLASIYGTHGPWTVQFAWDGAELRAVTANRAAAIVRGLR